MHDGYVRRVGEIIDRPLFEGMKKLIYMSSMYKKIGGTDNTLQKWKR